MSADTNKLNPDQRPKGLFVFPPPWIQLFISSVSLEKQINLSPGQLGIEDTCWVSVQLIRIF